MFDFPEPLFESWIEKPKICLVCANSLATKALWTSDKIIVPICYNCSVKWNLYGYSILKSIKIQTLIYNILKYKLKHLFSKPSFIEIYYDLKKLGEWSKKAKKFDKRS